MRPNLFGLILASTLCVAAAGPAHAIICYVVYDRNENVIYQNTYPPVDMSNAGQAQRDALRARGEHLTFGDINQCPNVVFLTGMAGMSEIKVDDVVAGLPARTVYSNAAAAAAASRGIPAGGPTPTGSRSPVSGPGAAPPTPPPPRSPY
jgi:hypothetical protein